MLSMVWLTRSMNNEVAVSPLPRQCNGLVRFVHL
jgi:hypothetical protein